MTREDAIKRLETHIAYHQSGAWPFTKTDEAMQMAIAALREQPRWIPVEERLPMIRTRVLVAYKDGVTVAEYRGYDVCKGKQQMYWCGIKGTKHVLRSITHWMPLPSTEGLK